MVYEVENMADFEKQLKNAGDKLVIVDFTATWCGPCKQISPKLEQLAVEYPNVVFLKVDVDEAEDVSQSCDIRCMPTFIAYKNQQRLEDFSGANEEKLRALVAKYV